MCIWVHIEEHTHTCTYTHTGIYIYMCVCISACLHNYIHTCIQTCIQTCIHTYMHTYMHTNMHTYIHACIHTYIHTFSTRCPVPGANKRWMKVFNRLKIDLRWIQNRVFVSSVNVSNFVGREVRAIPSGSTPAKWFLFLKQSTGVDSTWIFDDASTGKTYERTKRFFFNDHFRELQQRHFPFWNRTVNLFCWMSTRERCFVWDSIRAYEFQNWLRGAMGDLRSPETWLTLHPWHSIGKQEPWFGADWLVTSWFVSARQTRSANSCFGPEDHGPWRNTISCLEWHVPHVGCLHPYHPYLVFHWEQ